MRRKAFLPPVVALCLLGIPVPAAHAQTFGGEAVAQFRGGPTHRGMATGLGPETLGGVAWRFETDGPVRASPVVRGDRVYVGSTDRHLYALDAETGREVWRFDAGAEIAGAAAVTRDRVVFVDRSNVIHALDSETGAVRWQVRGGPDLPLPWGHEGWDYILASPTVADGTVVVGTGDGVLRALDPGDGTERWSFVTGGRIRSAPAVHDGVAYVGSGDGIVYGVSMDDGREVWRFETEGTGWEAADFGFDRRQIYSSPAVVDGILYIGSRDAADYAVELASGEVRWRYRDGSAWVIASPAVGPDRVYTGRSSGGLVLALDRATGEPAWQHATGGLVFSSPLLAGEVVYLGSGDGHLYAFEAATGEVRWRYRTEGGITSSPVLWRDRLLVGSQDGAVYAFRHGAATPRRAVYWDDGMMAGSAWGAQEEHRAAADYFESRGYEALDGGALVRFLEEAGRDGVPSVLVVAMDRVPEPVLTGGEASPLRQYLDRGGKVVWMGALPGVFTRNEEGAIDGVDRDAAGRLLDVDLGAWDTDEHFHRPTATGGRWGLEEGWMGWPGAAADAPGVTSLATDDLGRAGMWVRGYGGPEGTGFVLARPGAERSVLRQLRRVAEYGVMDDVVPGAR